MSLDLSAESRPESRAGLAEQIIDDEAVIVNARGGEILVLNATGAFLWQLLDGKHDVRTLSAKLREEFDVDQESADADVRSFLEALHEKGALAD